MDISWMAASWGVFFLASWAAASELSLHFVQEPPSTVLLTPSAGARVPCTATGNPAPSVTWRRGDNVRVVALPALLGLDSDGSLEFFPFRAEQFRSDIHAAVYRCVASNLLGAIGSRDVRIKAVLSTGGESRVDDEFVPVRNTAVLRCHVPTAVRSHSSLAEWFADDGLALPVSTSTDSNFGRYQTFKNGILHITNATPGDASRKYGCKMNNLLTGESMKSSTWAKLIVTDPKEQYPPRFVEESTRWRYTAGELALLPCVAHGNPPPQYRWYKLENGRTRSLQGRTEVRLGGTLVFRRVGLEDTGTYVCVANNSYGQGRIERELVITVALNVEIKPSRVQMTPGEDVILNCSVSGGPVSNVFWFKDQQTFKMSSRVRLLGVRSLQIKSFRPEDAGFYQCYAVNDEDSAQGAAEILQKGEAPVFVNSFSTQLVMPGRTASLFCVSHGWPIPQIHWLMDGVGIPESGRVSFGDYVFSNGSVASFVNLTNVKVQDGGRYQCTAQNEMGRVSHFARLDVLGPPVVRPVRNFTVAAGKSVLLHCPVSGYPVKEIFIERGNRRVPFQERQTIPEMGTLHIYGVRKEDEGSYKCIALSGRGERAEGNLVLQVVTAPVISPFSFPAELKEGMRAAVTCTVLAGDPPVTIKWFKDGSLVSQDQAEVEVVPVTDFVSSLIINSLKRHHTANYTCLAANEVAVVNFTSRMIVLAAPQWTLAPTDKMSTAGSPVVFDCQAEGEPTPVIRWKREEETKPVTYQNILSSPQVHVLENGSLHIAAATKQDQGFYVCEVTNGIGENLRNRVHLTIHNLPQVHCESHNVKVRRNEKATLSCTAVGDQPLIVTWKKDGVPIHVHGNSRYLNQETEKELSKVSRLILLSAEREDSALFTCLSSNPFGEDKIDIRVTVQEPPDSPSDLRPLDVTSSSVTLTWTPPFTGNLPLSGYTVHYKAQAGRKSSPSFIEAVVVQVYEWRSSTTKEIRLSGEEASATISDLDAISTYHFLVSAENMLGSSQPSRELSVTTRKGAPRVAPRDVTVMALNSSAVRVSWKIPLLDRPHLIEGFYIRYREVGITENYIYSTVDLTGGEETLDFTLAGLRRSGRYNVMVQAFNSEGAGPPSEELVVKTHKFDPPGRPEIKVEEVTSSSVVLTWEIEVNENPFNGFVLRYKEFTTGWSEVQISGHRSSYSLEGLRCGTGYVLHLTAFNNVGSGEASNSVQVTTTGKAPVAPERTSFLRCNSTVAILYLRAWKDNGCAITHFVVQYRPQVERDWILFSSHILPTEETVSLTDLSPATWYDLLLSAHSDAGSTEAEYRFATLTTAGGTVPPLAISTAASSSVFDDLTVLVPIVCAVVVLFVILVVVTVVLAWRRRDAAAAAAAAASNANDISDICSRNSGGRADDISMCSYSKSKGNSIYQTPREPLYMSSPYAASHVSAAAASQAAEARHLSSAYTGSLRRHQGLASDHIYDIPQRPPQQRSEQCAGHQYSRLWTTRPSGLRLPLANEKKKEADMLVMSKREKQLSRRPQTELYYQSDGSDTPSGEDVRCLAPRIEGEGSDLDGFSETECDRDHTLNRRYITGDLLPETIIVMC